MRRPRGGFTLIEIAAVMAIITTVLAMAVGAHYAWKRSSALDTALFRIESCFALARQQAIASGHPSLAVIGNAAPPDSVMFDFSTPLDKDAPHGVWCGVFDWTNQLDAATVCLEITEQSNVPDLPIVGAPAVFPPSVDACNNDQDDDTSDVVRVFVFSPDGSIAGAFRSAGENYFEDETGASLTNVVYGASAHAARREQDATQLASHTRILVIDPWLGTTRALSREDRERCFKENGGCSPTD